MLSGRRVLMSTTSDSIQRQKALDAVKPEIIKQVRDLVEGSDGKKVDWSWVGKRQFSGLVDAAAKASCVDELRIFIFYKRAKEGSKGWKDLAEPLVSRIDDLRSLAEKVAGDIKHRQQASGQGSRVITQSDEAFLAAIHLDLVRLFLGYFYWAVSAK
jgi:hypothetical protein